MSDLLKGVLIGVVTTAIISAFGYVLIVRDNQTQLKMMRIETDEIKNDIRLLIGIPEKIADLEIETYDTKDSLSRTKLAIAAEHPNRQLSSIDSIKKLESLSDEELRVLVEGLNHAGVQGLVAKPKRSSETVRVARPRSTWFSTEERERHRERLNYQLLLAEREETRNAVKRQEQQSKEGSHQSVGQQSVSATKMPPSLDNFRQLTATKHLTLKDLRAYSTVIGNQVTSKSSKRDGD